MAFALSGTTITQSGTDADLSGLAGIAGVETQIKLGATWYYLPDVKLNIGGTLSFDPRYEKIVTSDAAPIRTVEVLSGGTLNMGVEIILNGFSRYCDDLGMYISGEMGTSTQGFKEDTFGGLYIASGGTFNWLGGTINTARPTGFKDGSNLIIRRGTIDQSRATTTQNVQIRWGTTIDVIGLTVYGSLTTIFGASADVIQFEGYQPIHMLEPLVLAGGDKDNFFEVLNYVGEGNERDCTFLNNSTIRTRMINPNVGSGLIIEGHKGETGTNRDGIVEIVSDWELTTTDTQGTLIDGVKIFIEDVNNGDRKDPNYGTTEDYLTDKHVTTQTVNGVASDRHLVAVDVSNSDPTSPIDRRTTSNDATDITEFNLAHYNYSLSSINYSLYGVGVKEVSWVLLDDSLITEPDQAIAAAYLLQDTTAKVYDQLKSILVTNYLGETETIVTREGTTLDCRDLDLIIDGAGSDEAFVIGTTLTIYASEFTGSIATTGTVTLINGATIVGSITDVNGTLVPIQISAQDVTTLAPIEFARVYLAADAGGSLAAGTTIINDATDITGMLTSSFTVDGDQPVVGRIRSANDAPFYITSRISGTITSTGLSITALMISDE